MTRLRLAVLGFFSLAAIAPAQTPAPVLKVAVFNAQAVIAQIQDGQRAASHMRVMFAPRQAELEKKQQDIAALQDKLQKGANTMTDEAKQQLTREIDRKGVLLKREGDDFNADMELEQERVMNMLLGKIQSVVNRYASENGCALVLDISRQPTPVFYASNTIEITRDIVALYDKSAPKTPGIN